MTNPNEKYTVELSVAQWDLVVLALGYCYERAELVASSNYDPITKFARRLLHRRCNEVMAEIQSTVPDAGSDLANE